MKKIADEKIFFKELRNIYKKENRDFPWDWDSIKENKSFIYFIAYNLSKNILHGPLPSKIHNRMILDTDDVWSKKYSKFMTGE